MPEQVEGTVNHIIFQNPENGYTVFELGVSGGKELTCVGFFQLLTEGENALPSYIDFAEELDQIVFVCEEKPGEINLYYDMATEHLLVTRKGTGGNA